MVGLDNGSYNCVRQKCKGMRYGVMQKLIAYQWMISRTHG